jgi:superfamily II DNA or RNA helicase
MKVQIFKDGNLLRIPLKSDEVTRTLAGELQYLKKQHLVTRAQLAESRGRHIDISKVECYVLREYGGVTNLITNAGYLRRIRTALKDIGADIRVKDLRPTKRPERLVPCWDNLYEFEMRTGQREAIEAYAKRERGQLWWATGIGKSFLIPLMCRVMPKANIIITTKHLAPMMDLYHNLSKYLPSVGVYCSRKKKTGKRVMCYSAGSLGNADFQDNDILIADEVHELATDKMFEVFARFRFSRMFGLSANFEDRFDGADFELEGVFGPLIAQMTYQEGVDNGMIVPINVLWQNVKMPVNPAEGKQERVSKARHGLWRNKKRNEAIAECAKKYPDEQVLITVKTFDHACHLKKYLPDYTLVYAPGDTKESEIDRYMKKNKVLKDEPAMDYNRLEWLKSQFETGELRKVIATTVWNRGVNFKELQVLIRGDAGSSAIDDTQIPGRLSRISETTDKPSGVLIDFMDQFDDGLKRKADIRRRDYRNKGWNNIMPEGRRIRRRTAGT